MPDKPSPAASHGYQPRHGRETFFIEGEGLVGSPAAVKAVSARPRGRARAAAVVPDFRFSRMGPRGTRLQRGIRRKVAAAISAGGRDPVGRIPAGYTYLGQFVDHDLTFDATTVTLGVNVSPADLLQGRSPTLDLDSLYGAGPNDPVSAEFYEDDRHLKFGKTVRVDNLRARREYDLARVGDGSRRRPRRALIPDFRNDENLAVAQTHLAFIRFHNRVVDGLDSSVPARRRFRVARSEVIKHYQWMLRHDYLPRICDRAVVKDVFDNGRKVHEAGADPLTMPTMPVEFSVAAFRMGHSMIRATYDWNAEFPGRGGALFFLFDFSGTSGGLGGDELALPSNWIADWRRLYDFASIGRPDLKPPPGARNLARRIDTRLAPPLSDLPPGSFGGSFDDFGKLVADLAFRNLARATMVKLASGQQMAQLLRSKGVPVTTLTRRQILGGVADSGGAVLDALTDGERDSFAKATPLWFYVLREAELNDGRLTGVGARIVAETFHRAMEGSRHSILRDPDWRPTLGAVDNRFTMTDLLLVAYDNDKDVLAPLGD
ncbi:heme peroxidase family protein [Nocardioides sp.]|uniref:peroxidase family protein n=1 Tax=Nocardioides sp. TaxID=35761 RepID=UPI002ED62D7E